MKKVIDLLLVNSFAPRQRIASDAALENGLALIRTFLQSKGFTVTVIDEQRLSGAEQGVPKWCFHFLRLLVILQMKYYTSLKHLTLLFLLLAWPFQSLAIYRRKKYMDKLGDEIAQYVYTNSIPMVGIKIWYGDAYAWSIQLAKKIKRQNPDTIIVAGGPQVKVYGAKVLDEEIFDLAIMGPGEYILEKLLNMLSSTATKLAFLDKVHNQITRDRLISTGSYSQHGSYMFDNFIIPKYNEEDLKDKILFHTLVDGVGCSWNKCNFCSHSRQNVTHIPRPVEEIYAEIQTMTKQGIAFFRFSSSETPLSHGKAIAHTLMANNAHIHYSMFVRAGKVTEEIFDIYCLLIKSGLRAVFMGGETGHDVINEKVMNKGVTRKDIIETIQCIKLAAAKVAQPCKIGLSLIYPTPIVGPITFQDVFQANITMIEQTLPDTVIINPPGVFPGTIWSEQAEHFGFKIAEGFNTQLMSYEYSIFKPVNFWTKLNFSLHGYDMESLLHESGKFRQAVEGMGIPTNVSDEYLMMLTAIGHGSKTDLLIFKKHSLIDIMSGSSHYIKQIVEKINTYSRKMAAQNHTVN
ncbi:Radical SAM superfamily enzyme YgiQ, UPF0313 family [Dendrosporobacter quercicolus]|uniref:Radical SAM superfamily enzyme YgiQ, UPF0313 family n=2 Tax=Dendrosporobacter quercicolus TaxID=146817 RepID=A0A1G9XTS0_9FIRM|nr:cobalamin-dependent protein [Dendrosporobacter quercicolus]SDM99575.1 Radical SAM superfamily enzyme YgiQ, UPF0313 family [Dendrosporobacter quercicolus]